MNKTTIAKTLAVLGISFFSLFNLSNPSLAATNKDAKKILYVYNWTEYIPTSVIRAFEKETGIQVRYTTYESNEEMYSKLKITKGAGYDVVFPSSYYVNILKKDNLIQKLDKSKIAYSEIMPELLGKAYDPQNEFSVPYMYGFTVIGLNKDFVKQDAITSWADLWKPQYKDLILLNDPMDVFSMALLAKGVNPNHATDAQISTAFKDLQELQKKVIAYNSDSPEVPYVDGTTNLGMTWTGSAYRGQQDVKSLDVVYPKEGAILWIDNFAISAKAKNVEGAYKFINFILRPKNAKIILDEMGFQSASKGLKALLPASIQNNKILYPGKEVFDKAIMNENSPERILFFSNLWNKLKV